MQLTLEPGDREILLAKLGLAANASDDDLMAAVTQRLTAGPPAAAAPAPTLPPVDHDLIAAAVRDERIPASRADFWAQRYAEDPQGTRKKLERMHPGSAHYANNAAPDASADSSYPASWLPASRPVPGASRVTSEP